MGPQSAWQSESPGNSLHGRDLRLRATDSEPAVKATDATLLKQARAHGLGVVLATQNPVDLDYKGLSNAGTWFVGRLQAERDKARVIDGLEGASTSGFDRRETDRLLSGLTSRVFLMSNAHENAPMLFQTRWALSYLSGPLTGEQITRLNADRPYVEATTQAIFTAEAVQPDQLPTPSRPTIPTDTAERCLRVMHPAVREERLVYRTHPRSYRHASLRQREGAGGRLSGCDNAGSTYEGHRVAVEGRG